MSTITAEKKKELIGKFGGKPSNTGSTEVQISLLTERITNLTEHAKLHPNDVHNRRGLLMLVSKRRRLLDYLTKTDLEGYRALIKTLQIRR
ncbi:MAG TPA: 30S ribosomal protein S15 [Fibrobacteria bacterium]|jgi:small subunit ribosomal protein S15|nr:30S ribosomal protein S15 [Fibrobacteria bacterium]